MSKLIIRVLLLVLTIPAGVSASDITISPSVTVIREDVNGVLIKKNDRNLVVYGAPYKTLANVDAVLFTHCRRDLLWAGRSLVEQGAGAIVPGREKMLFTETDSFWSNFTINRFHDYEQQSTKLPVRPLEVQRTVSGGDTFEWEGISFRVLDTPGYTRGAVSFIADIDGIEMAFVGDLIYGDGRLFDLYSMQVSLSTIATPGIDISNYSRSISH